MHIHIGEFSTVPYGPLTSPQTYVSWVTIAQRFGMVPGGGGIVWEETFVEVVR